MRVKTKWEWQKLPFSFNEKWESKIWLWKQKVRMGVRVRVAFKVGKWDRDCSLWKSRLRENAREEWSASSQAASCTASRGGGVVAASSFPFLPSPFTPHSISFTTLQLHPNNPNPATQQPLFLQDASPLLGSSRQEMDEVRGLGTEQGLHVQGADGEPEGAGARPGDHRAREVNIYFF